MTLNKYFDENILFFECYKSNDNRLNGFYVSPTIGIDKLEFLDSHLSSFKLEVVISDHQSAGSSGNLWDGNAVASVYAEEHHNLSKDDRSFARSRVLILRPDGLDRSKFECWARSKMSENSTGEVIKYPLSVVVESGKVKSIQTSGNFTNKAPGDFGFSVVKSTQSLVQNIFKLCDFGNGKSVGV